MERVYTTSNFSWNHEKTAAVRVIPPTMIPVLDDEGNPRLDDEGEPILVPDVDNWERQMEEVELDTIVLIDGSDKNNPSVFKFAVPNEYLGKILAYYVQFLDVDSRKSVREALTSASGLIVPEVTASLKLVE